MRYDNIFWVFWVLIAPAFASCACFAFEMGCNFAESWNDCFEEVRRGFEMVGAKAKRENIHVSLHEVPATNYAEMGILVADRKRTP